MPKNITFPTFIKRLEEGIAQNDIQKVAKAYLQYTNEEVGTELTEVETVEYTEDIEDSVEPVEPVKETLNNGVLIYTTPIDKEKQEQNKKTAVPKQRRRRSTDIDNMNRRSDSFGMNTDTQAILERHKRN